MGSRNRRVGHLRKELVTSETARVDLRQVNMAISDELESMAQTLEKTSSENPEFQDCIPKLSKEVQRLRMRTFHAQE